KDVGTAGEVRGEVGLEVGEDAELRVERPRLVQVVTVLALPAEGRAVADLHSAEIDPAAGQELEVLLGEVGADHRRELDVREEGRSVREERGRAAERVGHLAERRPDVVERDRPGDQEISPGGRLDASAPWPSWWRAVARGGAPPAGWAARSAPAWSRGSTCRSGGRADAGPNPGTPPGP